MDVNLKIEYIPVTEIKKYKNNAKVHTEKQIDQIVESVKSFGFNDPIGIWKDEIVEGHGRYEAAKMLKLEKVPVIRLDHLTDKERKVYILAHNKLTMNTGFEMDNLLLEFEELEELGAELNLTGFDAAEIDDLFSKVHDKEIKEDDFDIDSELNEPAISKQGDMWLLGKHRLICGDSTKAETYEVLMEGKKANLVVTDPPYGVSYDGSQGTIKNDNLKDEEFYKFLFNAFTNMSNWMADDASIYVFHADTKGLIFRRAFEDAGFYLSGVCQWVKQSLVLGRSPYQWRNEPCLFGWKKKGKHNWYAGRKETTIWEFDKPSKSKLHSTMKPIALMSYPIKNSSMTNCIVLDPFAGSFSTGIACEQTDRICYAVEIDPKYVDVCVSRYQDYVRSDKGIFLVRDGVKIEYKHVLRELEQS